MMNNENVTEEDPCGCGHAHDDDHEHSTTYYRDIPKIGRNDPCYCGSGKKYKKCCWA